MENRKLYYIPLLFFILITVFFAFLFYNCIITYSVLDIDYEDLQYSELTFSKYETSPVSKSGPRYEIFFKEHDVPFEISSITQSKLDKKALEALKENDTLSVYYRKNSSSNFEFDICEIKNGSTVILSLSDYIKVNQNNQMIGIIVCSVFIIISLYVVWVFARIVKPQKENDLGKLKIEYTVGPNIIQVYNSLSVCSLVINGKVVDEFTGLVASNFTLSSEINFSGRLIPIVVKFNQFNLLLYCDDKLVCKKFMAFG